jgi:hypothetical protein
MELDQTQQPNNKETVAEKKKSSIRTYQSDLSKIVKNNNLSATKMVIEEESKRRKLFKKVSTETKKNASLITVSIILIVAGVISVFLLNILKPTPTIKVQEINLEPIIYTEYQKDLFFEAPSKAKISKAVQNEVSELNIPIGSMIQVYFTKRSTTNDEQQMGKSMIEISELTELLDFRISGTLLRFLEPNMSFGYHSTTENSPFLILKTRSFEDSFPEMLKWEETILENLQSIFIEDNPVFSKDRLRETKYQFKDIVIKNKDTRAILDGGGKILFVYSFSDKNTIVITTNKTTLQEVFDRLSNIYHTR